MLTLFQFKAISMEQVNHPEHYQSANGIEAIDVIETVLGLTGTIDFCKGNALKYLFRAGTKEGNPQQQDLRKAKWYINKAIQLLNKNKGIECGLNAKQAEEGSFYTVSAVLHTQLSVNSNAGMDMAQIDSMATKFIEENNPEWSVDELTVIPSTDIV